MTGIEEVFTDWTGHAPEGVWQAPGRVNLIGEHLDYNGGHVLPVAIGQCARVAVRCRRSGVLRARSVRYGEQVVPLDRLAAAAGWVAYPAGVLWAMAREGVEVGGLDVLVDSDVPPGAGLSSSAALECSIALALADLGGLETSTAEGRIRLARAAQAAETSVAGAPVGIMDQAVSLLAAAGRALLLDCRTMEWEHIAVPSAGSGWTLLAVDTGETHSHTANLYGARRRACEAAAAALGVDHLAQASPADVEGADLPAEVSGPARHVVTEEARTLAGVQALREGDMEEFGRLMTASHRSMQYDFANSTPTMDRVVDSALDAGAAGARMTGGGWGGTAVVLVGSSSRAAVGDALAAVLGDAGSSPVVVEPSAGARRIS